MPDEPGDDSATQSTSDWIFIEIWQQIVRGDLPPGERLTEEGLADMLDVSRTPLREAIRRLEETNLLVRQRRRTLRVAPLTIDEMVELSMTRESLEGMMARQASLRAQQDIAVLDPVEQVLTEMQEFGPEDDVNDLLRLGDRFHREIWEASGNRWGRRILQQLLLAFERYRHIVERDPVRSRELVPEHGAILAAIRSGDSLAAEVQMRAHIASARRAYMRGLQAKLAS